MKGRRKASFPQGIDKILEDFFKGQRKNFSFQRLKEIHKLWRELVGQKLSEVSVPVAILDNTLKVEISDPLWIGELHLLKGEIMARFRQRNETEGLEDISFYLAEPEDHSISLRDNPPPWKAVPLKKGEIKRIDEELKDLEDRDLARIIKNCLIKEKRFNRFISEKRGTL